MSQNIDKQITLFGAIFFLSGFSALVYQIVWQRLLFALFGVDMESVTIIVTVFMLGLGIGGKLGGLLADKYRILCVVMFLVCELFIGLFGFYSQDLIHLIASLGNDYLIIKAFILLLFPTILMGATLPLLSVSLIDKGGVIADVVGKLYSFNTLGAAFSCIFVGFIAFKYVGLNSALILAASINMIVVILGVLIWRHKQ